MIPTWGGLLGEFYDKSTEMQNQYVDVLFIASISRIQVYIFCVLSGSACVPPALWTQKI